jgi:hypothetical protein
MPVGNDKYIQYLDKDGTWDCKISQSWVDREIERQKRLAFWHGGIVWFFIGTVFGIIFRSQFS